MPHGAGRSDQQRGDRSRQAVPRHEGEGGHHRHRRRPARQILHKDKFLSAVESGFGFCNVVFGWDSADVCYDNARYTGWHTGYPDADARIDLSTYREVPWDDNVPFFLGDFGPRAAAPLGVCPRQLLKRVIDRARQGRLQRADVAGVRVVQLPRDAAVAGRQGLRRARSR